MADKKISQLTGATTPLAGTEELPIVQSSTTKKVTVANLTAGRAVSASSLSSTSKVSGKIVSSGSANRIFEVLAVGGSAIAEVVYNDTNDTLRISNLSNYVNASFALSNRGFDRLEILSNGNVACLTGNLVMTTAGKGVDFSSNAHAAGMTSELLNWYEEGAWTPVATPVAGTFTTVTASGRYVRVGKLVTVTIDALITNIGTATGLAGFSGLPFASENQNPLGSGALRNSLDSTTWSVLVTKNASACTTNKYDGTTVVVNNDRLLGAFSYLAA